MRVSKQTAILLKEAGSKLGSDFWCLTDSDDIIDTDKVGYRSRLLCPAPTLHEAADWERSKGVHVYTEPVWDGSKGWIGVVVLLTTFRRIDTEKFDTHEAAYEAGIVHGLKYIK